MSTQKDWWETDPYLGIEMIHPEMDQYAGPYGIGCVRAYDNGKTDPGWGMNPGKSGMAFMENYRSGKFDPQIALMGALSGRWNFAFIMRSMSLVCIDIDGKNGGLQNVGKLGMLPPTLAETSKSGDGYHLFYSTPWDVWDKATGFSGLKDRIGIQQGVDIRAVGCVYHYPLQQWNGRRIVELPDALKNTLLIKDQRTDQQVEQIIELLNGGDEDELLVVQDGLIQDLAKTIPAGRRNTTLYAIGSKMMLARVSGWQMRIYNRAIKVGLDSDEAKKIIANIIKYEGA
jgi:hypothetical protein